MKNIFKNRIKPLVIIQLVLIIPILIIYIFIFRKSSVNYFYNGIFQVIVAVSWLINGIENMILKKKGTALLFFILCIAFIYLAIQSFQLANMK